MKSYRLHLDSDGEVMLFEDDEETSLFAARLLGRPREELYGVVPVALWDRLEEMIAEEDEAVRYGRECRATAEDAYWRSR